VPIFNKRDFLPAVLTAIEEERSVTGGEIVLVDDGSTDGSAAIIRDFASGRPNVITYTQPNAGVAAATNRGFALASQPLIRFVDADDVIIPGSTRRLARVIEEQGVGLAYGATRHYRGNVAGLPVPDLEAAAATILTDPVRRCLTSQAFIPSVMVALRAEIAGAFPLPETHRTSQDFILSLRCARRTRFVVLDAPCCWVPEEAPGRLSASKARMFADTALLLAEEWESGRDGPWSATHARHAVRRMAGRARNYLARHVPGSTGVRVWLAWERLRASLPIGHPDAATLRRIAAAYGPALAEPGRFP